MKHLLSVAIVLIMALSYAAHAQVKTINQKKQQDTIYGLVTYKQAIKVEGAKIIFEKETKPLQMPASLVKATERMARDSSFSITPLVNNAPQALIQAVESTEGPTVGQLDVSATGAATYTVPINLPPGIGNIVPQVALVYNSQGTNGVVGLGWSIGGLSVITRIPSTSFHDNKITAVNFNVNDRFALDGQRLLLKSGTYGGDGAEYQTENYSNIKIVSRGVSPFGETYGPAYFEVFIPDGSKAVYGATNGSRTSTTFALTYMENPMGARINYTYSVSANTLIVTEIAYGNLGSSQIRNKINFYYDEINRAEMGFTAGDRLYRKSLLNSISVTANGSAYRNYLLTLENIPTLNYKRVTSITEYNGDQSLARSPLNFTYHATNNTITTSSINNLSWTGLSSTNSEVIPSDFTGDGRMDFILRPKNNSSSLTLFYDLEKRSNEYMTIGADINTGSYENIFTGNILTSNDKLMSQSGITLVRKGNNINSFKFDSYLYTVYAPMLFQYDRVWENVPRIPDYFSECDQKWYPGDLLVMNFFSGDFNGDGLMDVIAINSAKKIRRPYTQLCLMASVEFPSSAHFINLDSRITTNFVTNLGQLTKGLNDGEKIYTYDFNGDGKTDILHIRSGEMLVYGLNESNSSLEPLWQTPNSNIKNSEQALFGDYNGDGKTDVMFSTGYNNTFAMFLSTGRGFDIKVLNYPFTNEKPEMFGTYFQHGYLIPTDINNDGKTDIVEVYNYTQNNTGGWTTITVHHNMGTSPALEQHFAKGGIASVWSGAHYPIPIFLNMDKQNPRMEFGLISMNAIRLVKFEKDFKSEAQLSAISQDGVVHQIAYKNLVANQDGIDNGLSYTSSYDQTYPNIDHHNLAGLNVVDRVTRTYNNQQIQQVFGYALGVSNLQGLGFLGFGKLVRSNWYVNDYDQNRMFNITLSNPQLRGMVTKTFTAKLPSLGPIAMDSPTPTVSDYLSRTDYTYQTSLLPNKVFVNVPSSIFSRDVMNGTSSVQTNEYDGYYNIARTVSSFGAVGTKTEEITYDNNPSGYYIGRPLTRRITLTADGDSHSTEEEYSYTGYLPTQIKKKGNGTTWTIENNTFDAYGNTTQKSTTTQTGTRTTKAAYDATGRFAISKTDVEGLTSKATYNPATGDLLSTTNPYGQTTTTAYDTWGRIIEIKDYLGKKSYKRYGADSYGYSVSESDDEGREKESYINHLGQPIQTIEKTLTGTRLGAVVTYDVYGRAYQQSQPALPGSYSQWNTTEYDQYGRVSKVTAYTGKMTQYTYNGLSTIINDGSKIVTTTKNALGQTVKVQDPGGTINYKYYAHGGLKSADYGGSVQTLEYDGWGRKTKLADPSAGVYTYTYNGFGEVVQETTPKGTSTYTYDNNTGKLIGKTLNGDATNMVYNYTYNNTTKLPEGLNLANADGNNASYSYTYDNDKRLVSTVEDNLHARFTKNYTYDSFGRTATETYQAKDKASNSTATRTIGYTYQNGELLQTTDLATGQVISKVTAIEPNGQLSTTTQGDKLKTSYSYDNFNLPQSMVTERIGASPATLMNLGYRFDALRGNLNSRSNSALNWTESFSYDNLDRLTDFNDNSGSNSQSYDNRGRIASSSQLGSYIYNGDSYQQSELTNPTPQATTWYQSRAFQQISFNAFKKPVNINEKDKEQLDFQYNAALQRSHMYYGSTDADKNLRPMRRHYSEDGGMEITRNLTTGETSFVFYLSGDAYDTPAIYKQIIQQQTNQTTNNLYYLHRDHLGSIVLITDVNGNAVEKRQFDAWGKVVKLEDGLGNPLTMLLITDRGYTGHEHLLNVGLINMNGRLYDPKLHRFLSPDNFVQDPYNSQNFNRYGYTTNNPLLYVDKNGEFFWIPIIIGAVVGAYTGGTLANNGQLNPFKWDYSSGKTWGYMLGGAIVGGASGLAGGSITSWVGANATTHLGGLSAVGVGGAAAGAISGAGFSLLSGGNILEGFWKGTAAGLVGGLAGGYVGGGAGALVGGGASGATSTMLYGGDLQDIGISALIGGAVSYSLYQVQMGINYAKYKANGGSLTKNQFRTISTAMQRSFARGKEYGGWIMDDGTIDMRYKGQTRKSIDLGFDKPKGAIGVFHTHPNLSPSSAEFQWSLSHGKMDLSLNNVFWKTNSWVFGRQNVYSHFHGFNTAIPQFSNRLFYPYPFNTYYFPR